MSAKHTVRIGLLGFGVVGQGVWKNIEKNRQALESGLGARLEIAQVVVRHPDRKRDIQVPSGCLSTDASKGGRQPGD